MTHPAPEFSRIVRLDEIGRMRWPAHIAAEAEERAALARRFGFVEIASLEADYTLTRENEGIMATGEIRAALSQPCVATAEPVAERVREAFSIRFTPEGEAPVQGNEDEIEIEIDADGIDIVTYADERIDIGEAIAETLALSVTPYPRSPDADTILKAAGVLSEDQAGPFAALAALRTKEE